MLTVDRLIDLVLLHEAENQGQVALRQAAKTSKGFVGPNGNILVGYLWISRVEDVDTGKDIVAMRVSDWDNAVLCASCKRKIVHAYYVKSPNTGNVFVYGSEHLHTALGYGAPLNKAAVTNLHRKVQDFANEQRLQDNLKKGYEELVRVSAVSVRDEHPLLDANQNFAKLGHKPSKTGPVWLYNKQKGLLMRGDAVALDRFMDVLPGWEQVDDAFSLVQSLR